MSRDRTFSTESSSACVLFDDTSSSDGVDATSTSSSVDDDIGLLRFFERKGSMSRMVSATLLRTVSDLAGDSGMADCVAFLFRTSSMDLKGILAVEGRSSCVAEVERFSPVLPDERNEVEAKASVSDADDAVFR